jgi:hypothetical protein
MTSGTKLARFWLHVSVGYGQISWREWAVCFLQAFMLSLVALAPAMYALARLAAGARVAVVNRAPRAASEPTSP